MRKRTTPLPPCKTCGKPARYVTKQLCTVHYQLQYVSEVKATASLGYCICGAPALRKNLCLRHYDQEWRTDWRQGIRKRIIEAYGGKCSCASCPETNPEFLTLDHINRDGAEDRRKKKSVGGISFWRAVELEGYPLDKYQLLCYNCNMGRERFGGRCPHV